MSVWVLSAWYVNTVSGFGFVCHPAKREIGGYRGIFLARTSGTGCLGPGLLVDTRGLLLSAVSQITGHRHSSWQTTRMNHKYEARFLLLNKKSNRPSFCSLFFVHCIFVLSSTALGDFPSRGRSLPAFVWPQIKLRREATLPLRSTKPQGHTGRGVLFLKQSRLIEIKLVCWQKGSIHNSLRSQKAIYSRQVKAQSPIWPLGFPAHWSRETPGA